MGHPVLRLRAEPVADPSAPAVARLAEDMIETVMRMTAAGLAAPQLGMPSRIIAFRVPAARAANPAAAEGAPDGPIPITVLINPQIEVLDATVETGWEACLSVPGLTGKVGRARAIRYAGLDLNGRMLTREAIGFHARVVQHECDHLDGILYPDRLADPGAFGFVEEVRQYQPAEAAR